MYKKDGLLVAVTDTIEGQQLEGPWRMLREQAAAWAQRNERIYRVDAAILLREIWKLAITNWAREHLYPVAADSDWKEYDRMASEWFGAKLEAMRRESKGSHVTEVRASKRTGTEDDEEIWY